MIRHFLIFLGILVSTSVYAQFANGNFENDNGEADLSAWVHTCGELASVADTPEGTMSTWCLQADAGNTQGCFPSYVFQLFPEAQNGETWTFSAWAKQDELSPPFTVTSLKIMYINTAYLTNPLAWDNVVASDSTVSTTWDLLNFSHTFALAEGQMAVLVLDAGLTGGPVYGASYFDLVTATNISTTIDPVLPANEPLKAQVHPNPFATNFAITFYQTESQKINITAYSIQGERTAMLYEAIYAEGWHTLYYDTSTWQQGVYFVRINNAHTWQTFSLVKQ